MLTWLQSVRKALVAGVGTAITLLTVYNEIPFLPDKPVVAGILGALTTLATWLVPNKQSTVKQPTAK